MASAVSPLAPSNFPDMPEVPGVRLATGAAGIRYKGRTDVLLALFEAGTTVAGVFTRSKCPSAPVDWCRERLKAGKATALVVNSGNANAFTGRSGRTATKLTADIASKAAGCKPAQIFLASTGVIGEPLDATAFAGVMDGLVADAAPGQWATAAKAIMTTDTFPKGASAEAKLGKATVTICGIAKGAGMIAPDMATMLAFIFTDAPIAAPALQRLLADGVGDTFNAVTIDGDTSTSDTLLAFATGAAAAHGAPRIARAADPRLKDFTKALHAVHGEPRRTGGARRRRRAQARRGHRRGRDLGEIGAAHCDVDRQLAAGQNRDRRRGRQLGPRRHGGGQGRRAGRP